MIWPLAIFTKALTWSGIILQLYGNGLIVPGITTRFSYGAAWSLKTTAANFGAVNFQPFTIFQVSAAIYFWHGLESNTGVGFDYTFSAAI